MKFRHILAEVTWLVLCERRVTYRRIKREFSLDNDALEDVRHELIQIKCCAVDLDGEFLVWAGTTDSAKSAQTAAELPSIEPLVPLHEKRSTPLTVPLPFATDPSSTTDSSTASAPSSDAERRPLTVMFCDLADSTTLSTQLDPEDLQDVIRTYQEICTCQIQEYEGFVAKYMGDGILVYFGYPKSLERNAERAVHSALGIVEAITRLNQTLGQEKGVEIAVRIGIATGMVMVGEIIGEGMAQERTVIGEAPNMAARLQGVANRNGIVIGSLTRELSGNAFVYDDLGSHELKGISGLVQAWGVIGMQALVSHEADQGEGGETPTIEKLIGRDEETGLLRRAWQSTNEEGLGQVVMISGEAGIGKSALIDGLRAEVRAAGGEQMTVRCSPYHTSSALYPVVEYFKHLSGWQVEDTVRARVAKLETLLKGFTLPLGETVPLLASLLSLALPEERYPPVVLTPQQQKRQTQDTIIAITLEAAERQPLLELWEDLHWADPSTLELLGLLIEQAPTASLLMVLTARPEFVPPWSTRSHITQITLNRLERLHAEAFVVRVAGMKPLPNEVVSHIVAKTDGVPLYIEELTKTILASKILLDSGERFELTGPLSSLAIPDTLQELLMARLDSLPQLRELAQLGSVLGREFTYEMISGLSTANETVLQEGLGQLVDAELLYQRGRPPRARYIFKHALIQDAAYATLLRRTRQQHHLHVAQFMEAHSPEIVETHPDLIAHHYSEANVADRAVDYFQIAGEQAVKLSAHLEAIAHLTKGLEILGTVADGPERLQREVAMLTTMGPALISTKGYAAPAVEITYRRALELCQESANEPRMFSVLHGLWYYRYARGDLYTAQDLASQLVDLSAAQQDSGLELAAQRSLGYTLLSRGELREAQSSFERVISSYDTTVHNAYAARYGGADPGSGSLGNSAWALAVLGSFDQAIDRCHRGLVLARELGHPFSEVYAHITVAVVHQFRGEAGETLLHADAGAEIANNRGFALFVGWTTALRGWSLFQQGGGSDAITVLREGIDLSRATGADLVAPYWLALLADAYGQSGRVSDGLVMVDEALGVVARTGERLWEAELNRLKGELLLKGDAANESTAEASFLSAIAIAQAQDAKTWELRAATSLSRLWQQQNKQDEARDLLLPVYTWFSEGLDTKNLKEARLLLDELAPSGPIAVRIE